MRSDLVMCVRYYDHKTSFFCKIMTKDHYSFGHISNFYFVTKFQNHGNEHNQGLLWIKDALMYGMHTNEEIE